MDNFSPGHLPQMLLPSQRLTRDNVNKITYALRKMNQGVAPSTIIQPNELPYPQQPPNVSTLYPIILELDGGGSAITATTPTTAGACVPITQPCMITQWQIWADKSDSAVIDIWRANGAVPTSINSIVGALGNKPTLSSQQINISTPSSWNSIQLVAGDLIGFGVTTAPASATRITVALTVQR